MQYCFCYLKPKEMQTQPVANKPGWFITGYYIYYPIHKDRSMLSPSYLCTKTRELHEQ